MYVCMYVYVYIYIYIYIYIYSVLLAAPPVPAIHCTPRPLHPPLRSASIISIFGFSI